MILAEKIIEERKKNGWTQEELAEKLNVSRQAISKWESAGAVPDLQRIIRMSELFGVSTDYLLKDDMLPQNAPTEMEELSVTDKPLYRVTMEEANAFLEHKRKNAPVIANATSMCILSPALLIVLGAMSETEVYGVTEKIAAVIGCVCLFGLVAAAVYMFITCGIKNESIVHLEKNLFETEYGVSGMAKERKAAFQPAFTRGISFGVVLCIVSVIPLLLAGAMEAQDYVCGIFTAVMLAIIALGVNMIIRAAIIRDSYDALLQEGDFTKEEKAAGGRGEAIIGAYWSIVVAVYLGWSFWTGRWDFTWLVWPVAGVLSPVVKKITVALTKK